MWFHVLPSDERFLKDRSLKFKRLEKGNIDHENKYLTYDLETRWIHPLAPQDHEEVNR